MKHHSQDYFFKKSQYCIFSMFLVFSAQNIEASNKKLFIKNKWDSKNEFQNQSVWLFERKNPDESRLISIQNEKEIRLNFHKKVLTGYSIKISSRKRKHYFIFKTPGDAANPYQKNKYFQNQQFNLVSYRSRVLRTWSSGPVDENSSGDLSGGEGGSYSSRICDRRTPSAVIDIQNLSSKITDMSLLDKNCEAWPAEWKQKLSDSLQNILINADSSLNKCFQNLTSEGTNSKLSSTDQICESVIDDLPSSSILNTYRKRHSQSKYPMVSCAILSQGDLNKSNTNSNECLAGNFLESEGKIILSLSPHCKNSPSSVIDSHLLWILYHENFHGLEGGSDAGLNPHQSEKLVQRLTTYCTSKSTKTKADFCGEFNGDVVSLAPAGVAEAQTEIRLGSPPVELGAELVTELPGPMIEGGSSGLMASVSDLSPNGSSTLENPKEEPLPPAVEDLTGAIENEANRISDSLGTVGAGAAVAGWGTKMVSWVAGASGGVGVSNGSLRLGSRTDGNSGSPVSGARRVASVGSQTGSSNPKENGFGGTSTVAPLGGVDPSSVARSRATTPSPLVGTSKGGPTMNTATASSPLTLAGNRGPASGAVNSPDIAGTNNQPRVRAQKKLNEVLKVSNGKKILKENEQKQLEQVLAGFYNLKNPDQIRKYLLDKNTLLAQLGVYISDPKSNRKSFGASSPNRAKIIFSLSEIGRNGPDLIIE